MSGELAVAVHAMLSVKVVDASATVTDCEPPLLSGTDVADGVIVYAGAVTNRDCVPLEVANPDPEAGA
jgi:hypothetical protein